MFCIADQVLPFGRWFRFSMNKVVTNNPGERTQGSRVPQPGSLAVGMDSEVSAAVTTQSCQVASDYPSGWPLVPVCLGLPWCPRKPCRSSKIRMVYRGLSWFKN